MKDLTARSPTDLTELVRKAKAYDQVAIDELYRRFEGMIVNLVKQEEIRKALGEDAVNIAWEIFYSTVYKLDLERTQNIAGYLKVVVCNGLKRKMQESSRGITYLDTEDGNLEFAEFDERYDTVLMSYTFAGFLAELDGDSKKLMTLLYVDGLTLTQASKTLGRSYKATAKLKYKCLKKLKKYLQE